MGKRNSKGGSKKSNSKKHRKKNKESNVSQKEEENSQQEKCEGLYETTSQDSVEDTGDIHTDSSATENSAKTSTETSATDTTSTTDINDYCEEIKAKQEEHLKKLNDLSIALTGLTLIRDNVNSIRVDTLTELYFTRQVRPLLDALAIIAFAVSNMTTAAVNIQTNTFGDRKEIRHALNLSYKMNDEVDDVIDSLDRRLKIFLDQIDKIDKNCPPFNSGKDS